MRRLRHACVVLVLAWVSVQGLREAWRAMWYHLADPWPAEAPVLWTPSSVHVERLRADLDRLPLERFTTLAVATEPALGEQAWYQYLWLAYLLPTHDLIWAPDGEPQPAADAWLVLDLHRPSLRPPEP